MSKVKEEPLTEGVIGPEHCHDQKSAIGDYAIGSRSYQKRRLRCGARRLSMAMCVFQPRPKSLGANEIDNKYVSVTDPVPDIRQSPYPSVYTAMSRQRAIKIDRLPFDTTAGIDPTNRVCPSNQSTSDIGIVLKCTKATHDP